MTKKQAFQIKFECVHADTCLPDYWCGHHLPHVQVPVWHGMTPAQLRQALRDELSQGVVMGSTDNARLLSADMVRDGEEVRAGMLTKAAHAAIDKVHQAKKNTHRLFLDLEKDTDDDYNDSVYAFFVFVELD